MLEVVCLGEALVDLVAVRRGPLRASPGFRRYAGGAPANVARGLARLGVRVGWVWAVGADEFGAFLVREMAADGVDVSRARRLAGGPTGLSFIALDESGERSFTGYGQPDAGSAFAVAALDLDYVASARVLHLGSNTLLSEPNRAATLAAIAAARQAERYVSLDVNLRPHLWSDLGRALATVREVGGGVDLLKASAEEARALTGVSEPLGAAQALRRWGAGLAVVTLSRRGCVFSAESGDGEVPGFSVETVDATGAGDAFQAGLLHALLPHLAAGREPAALGSEEVSAALEEANRVGAAAVRAEGAVEWRLGDLPPRRR